MKEHRNSWLSSVLVSVGIAAVVFCLAGVIVDLIDKGNLSMENYAYTKMAAGALVVGLGFGIPAFIYENEKLSLPVKTLFHMGIGCVVMTVTAFAVGWIPTEKGFATAAFAVLCELVSAFIVWLFFYSRQKKLAERMNIEIEKLNR